MMPAPWTSAAMMHAGELQPWRIDGGEVGPRGRRPSGGKLQGSPCMAQTILFLRQRHHRHPGTTLPACLLWWRASHRATHGLHWALRQAKPCCRAGSWMSTMCVSLAGAS